MGYSKKGRKCTENRLNKVEPVLGDCRLQRHVSSQEEIVLSHLCIGYIHLTHCYQMNGEYVPRCVACDCNLSVEHILNKCAGLTEIRQRYYYAENLQQLFQKISVICVFDLCKIGVLYRI